MRVSAAEARKMMEEAADAKTGNRRVAGATRCTAMGIKFDSKREARVFLGLYDDQKRGKIRDLQLQVKIPLMGQLAGLLTPTGKQAHYVADFTFVDVATGQLVVADAKGHPTEIFQLKHSILVAQGITVRLM